MSHYSQYKTVDDAVDGWVRAMRSTMDWIDRCFAEYRAGNISLDTLQFRCKLMPSPISDEDLEAATAEAVRIAPIIEAEKLST